MAGDSLRKRILIIRGGALGDFLLTLPAIDAIRRRLPEASITLVTRPAYGALMLACGYVQEVRNLESASMAALFGPGALPDDVQNWLAEFDEVFAWTTDADGVVAQHFRGACRGTWHILNPVMQPSGNHASDQLASGLPFSCEPFAQVQQWTPTEEFTLAIHLGSGSANKNWPVEKWLELVDRLIKEERPLAPQKILIIAGEADAAVTSKFLKGFASLSGKIPIILEVAEHLPLDELAQFLARCRFYIGHDTGVSHLAAVCGVPSLWLFGPTDPCVWAPRAPNAHYLTSPTKEMQYLNLELVMDALRTQVISTPKRSGL
jgi:heptosyltransferase-2